MIILCILYQINVMQIYIYTHLPFFHGLFRNRSLFELPSGREIQQGAGIIRLPIHTPEAAGDRNPRQGCQRKPLGPSSKWVFPKIEVSPKWMVYNGKPY